MAVLKRKERARSKSQECTMLNIIAINREQIARHTNLSLLKLQNRMKDKTEVCADNSILIREK